MGLFLLLTLDPYQPTNHGDAEGFTIPPPDHGPWSDTGMSSNYDDERSETSR